MSATFDSVAYASDSFVPFLVRVTAPNGADPTLSGTSLFLLPDLVLAGAGTFRIATVAESVAQDVTHMLADIGDIGEPTTSVFVATVAAKVKALLATHPDVTSIDVIDVAPIPGMNRTTVTIGVNAEAAPSATGI